MLSISNSPLPPAYDHALAVYRMLLAAPGDALLRAYYLVVVCGGDDYPTGWTMPHEIADGC